jgi:hypothetical protein
MDLTRPGREHDVRNLYTCGTPIMQVAAMALLPFLSPVTAGGDEPLQPGTREQLFLDDYSIAQMTGITRRVNQAEKYPLPVIEPDQPWEAGLVMLFGTVMHDDEEQIYKAWYCSGAHDVAYAVSQDGLHWDKPRLDVVRYKGTATNIVVGHGELGHFYELNGVLKDANDPDPARRYKMGFVSLERGFDGTYPHQFHNGERRGFGTAVSPDGIHWTLENDFATTDVCDISRFYRRPETGTYVVFGRTKLTPGRNDGRWALYGWGRAVHYLESPDFRTWGEPQLVLAADARDPQGAEVYSVSAFEYEGLTLGLIQMFYGLADQGNLDLQLGLSRDGRQFARVEPRTPFIPEGPVGSWDRFNISIGSLPPVSVGDELWFYYGGRTYRHSPYQGNDKGPPAGRIGLARIKRGRFLALEASFAGGTVLTRPLVLAGTALRLNANARYGAIDVALLGAQGNELATCVVQGEDGTAVKAGLDGQTLSGAKGSPVQLRLTLRNAQLYGFRFE